MEQSQLFYEKWNPSSAKKMVQIGDMVDILRPSLFDRQHINEQVGVSRMCAALNRYF